MQNACNALTLLSALFVQSIDISFFLQALNRREVKVLLDIYPGEFRRNAVSDLKRILDGLVVRDRDFIETLNVNLVGAVQGFEVGGPHVFAQYIQRLLFVFYYSGDAGHISLGDSANHIWIILRVLSRRPQGIND